MYVYITINEPDCQTRYRVGFISPNGNFVVEHETTNRYAAAARTSWLNGGPHLTVIGLDCIENPPEEIA